MAKQKRREQVELIKKAKEDAAIALLNEMDTKGLDDILL